MYNNGELECVIEEIIESIKDKELISDSDMLLKAISEYVTSRTPNIVVIDTNNEL